MIVFGIASDADQSTSQGGVQTTVATLRL
jgi:hypothetical protein